MSGHSKWANIKRKKQANDLVRGNVFAKLSRAITLAVVEGGGITDPEHNVRLRFAIEKAHQGNMPKENIQRAIERGVGPNKQDLKEIVYEAFGPSGVALIIVGASDNINRTLSEVRNILDRHGGKLANQGAVSYLFQKCGLVLFLKGDTTEEQVLQFSDEIHAIDIDQDPDYYYIYIPFERLGKIKEFLHGTTYHSAEIDYKPQSYIPVSRQEILTKLENLEKSLEDLEDIQKVFMNVEVVT